MVGRRSEAPLVPPDRLHRPSNAMPLRPSRLQLTTTFQNRKSSMAKQNKATGTTPLTPATVRVPPWAGGADVALFPVVGIGASAGDSKR